MNGSVRGILKNTSVFHQNVRFAWKFKRYNPQLLGESRVSKYVVGKYVLDYNPDQPILETRHYYDDVYTDIYNTDDDPKPPIKLILLKNIRLLGIRGEIVEVDCATARHKLIPSQKAVYASPQNLVIYKKIIDESKYSPDLPSSKNSQSTLLKLETQFVLVLMNHANPWTITPSHIRIAFRAAGIRVPDSGIELPQTPITGPNLSNNGKDFIVWITINNNKNEKVPVRCVLYHTHQPVHRLWHRLAPRKALIPEQEKMLNKMFMHEPYYEEEEKELFV